MEPISVTLSDLEGHFNCSKPSQSQTLYFGKYSTY